MTDREICKEIIERNGCGHWHKLVCDNPSLYQIECPLDRMCNGSDFSVKSAKQWLQGHPEKYTYADVNLPEWWDGRPIWGRHIWLGMKHEYCYCVGFNPFNREKPFLVDWNDGVKSVANFEPITETPITAKVSITKDGVTKEIELTTEQIKDLGL